MNNPFRPIADQAHKQAVREYYLRLETEHPAGVIFYDIFNETFGKLIVEECARSCGSQADMRNVRKRFGLPVESNIKYPGPEPTGHETQYTRPYNLPIVTESEGGELD